MKGPLLVVWLQNLLIFVVFAGGRVLLTLYALALGANAMEVGLILGLVYLVPGLLSWPAGALADRYGSARLLIWSSLLNALGLLAPVFWPSLIALGIGAAGVGVGVAMGNVLGQRLVGLLSTPETRTRNFSNYSLVGALGNFAGPLLAGLAIDHAGHATASLLLGVVAVLAAGVVVVRGSLLPGGEAQAKRDGNLLATLAEPGVRRVMYLSSIGQMGLDCFLSFMPVYAHGVGLSASVIGASLALTAVATVCTRLFLARIIASRGERGAMMCGFALGAAACFLLPLFQTAVTVATVCFVFGVFMGTTQPIAMMMMYASAPPGRVGEALGLRLAFNNLLRVFAPLAFGATARVFGLAPLFVASGALLCLGGYLCGVPVKGARSA